jgi:membrane protein YdbS with pleckstrin-like domain
MGVASLLLSNILGFAFLLWVFLNVWPIAVIIAIGGLAWAYLDFTVLRFELREEGVFIRRGFITRSENLFLYRNIQDVEEIASVWDRVLGLKTLSIKTMTASSVAGAQMPFISGDIAPKLREEIIALSKKESQKAEKKAREERITPGPTAGKIGAFAMKIGEEASFERPKIEEKEMPYSNKFYRGALYSSAISCIAVLAIWAFVSLVLLLLNQLGPIFLAFALALLAMALVLFASCSLAFLSDMSLRYTVSTDFMLIKTGILNIAKKQVNYNKIQDVEKHTSFTQSFAGLSTVKLETGSRESVGSKGETASSVTQNETVPDLNSKDAEELKQTILRQMCISSKGIGVNPLISRFPLESIKPLKKTVWWIVYSAIILVAVAALVFLFAKSLLWLPFPLFAFLASACILKYVYELYYYKRYFYDLNDDMLVISKGVFGTRELTVPFDKIQDVFIDRDWLDLAFGLYDVYVTTVSSRSILNAHIDGVSEKNAEQIAELLLKKIKA